MQIESDLAIPPSPKRPKKKQVLQTVAPVAQGSVEVPEQLEDTLPHSDGNVHAEGQSSPQTPDSPLPKPKKPEIPQMRRRQSGRISVNTARDASPKGTPSKRIKQAKVSKPKSSSKRSRAGDEIWEVEDIVGSVIEADTYIHYYQVKWKGYSSKENTWEPKKHLRNCHEAIERFERSK